jgi:shikimate dehydrogenase
MSDAHSPASPVDRYAVVGNPVGHSRSPFIHAAFAAQTAQAIEYTRLPATDDDFERVLQHFAATGGRGVNVTVPFKFRAFELCPRRTPRALLARAANTLRFDGEGWWADNTDGVGLVRDIEAGAGVGLADRRVLVIGAGGAAAGVLGPLLQARPAAVTVANRSLERAQALVHAHRAWADAQGARLEAASLHQAGRAFDVVLNASASSLAGTAVPVDSAVLRPGGLAVDLMYGPPAQPFLAWAQAHGAIGRDGLGMLVEQAAEAFTLWRGVQPQTQPVLALLRTAVVAGT